VHLSRRLIQIREGVAPQDHGHCLLVSLDLTRKEVITLDITTLFVGIDVSKTSNVVRFMDGSGDTLSLFSVQNNADGAAKLYEKLRYTLLHTDYSALKIGMESTSVYSDHLVMYLRNDHFLQQWGCKVYLFNAKQISNFKKSYPVLPKDDNIDTLIIADFLRFDRLPKEVCLDDKHIALRNLTRARFQAAQNLSREKTRFVVTLFQKFSTLDSSKVFSNTFGATALSVACDFMSIDDIIYMPIDELTNFINTKGKGKFVDPAEIAKALQAAARSSYRVSKTVNDSLNQLLAIRLIGIRSIEEQIKSLDKAIEMFMGAFQNVLISVPGIGPVYSAGIMAEVGAICRFKGQAALAKFAGLMWSKYHSGGYEAANTRLVVSGNKYLRYYLLEAANKVRMHDTEFERFYKLKFREVPKHQHKRALALTARKLVRLVYSLLSTNRLYTSPTEK
jgi:transposase